MEEIEPFMVIHEEVKIIELGKVSQAQKDKNTPKSKMRRLNSEVVDSG